MWASAHCVAKKKELLFTPLQRHQEFGFVGFDRIRMSCRGSENPMPSVYLIHINPVLASRRIRVGQRMGGGIADRSDG